MAGIYCIENISNNMKYIGWSINIDKRFKTHLRMLKNNNHHNNYLQHAWNKEGKENFNFWIIEECPAEEEILNLMEIYFISYYDSFVGDGKGYNLTRGGDGVLGYVPSIETKNAISHSNLGKKVSLETRELISENHADFKGENHPQFGIPKSENQKKKESELFSGKGNPRFGTKLLRATSQYYNVYRVVQKNYIVWRAGFTENKKGIRIGDFKTEIEAAMASDKYIIKNNLDRPLNFSRDCL